MGRTVTNIYPTNDVQHGAHANGYPNTTYWYIDVGVDYFDKGTGYIQMHQNEVAAVLQTTVNILQAGEQYKSMKMYVSAFYQYADGGCNLLIEYSLDSGATWVTAANQYIVQWSQGHLYSYDNLSLGGRTGTINIWVRFTISGSLDYGNYIAGLKFDITTSSVASLTVALTEPADTLVCLPETRYGFASLSCKPGGVQALACSGVLTNIAPLSGPVTLKRADVASDSGFTTILATTGDVAGTGAEDTGDLVMLLLSWSPPAVGTYYARIGTQIARIPTYKYVTQSFVVGFPSGVVLTHSVDGNRLTLTLTIQDTYNKPPNVTFGVDNDMIAPATITRSGAGPYTYTVVATCEVETGEHRVTAVVGNVWTTLSIAQQQVIVPVAWYTPRQEVYQGNERVDAENVRVTERFLPDGSDASFTVLPGVHLSGDVTIKQYGGGLKIHKMTVTGQMGREVSCVSAFATVTKTVVHIQTIAVSTADLLTQIVRPAILCGRTDLLTGTRELLDIETTVDNIAVETATLCGVQLYERGGRVHVVPLAPAVGEEQLALHDGDPGATRSINYQGIVNHIRQDYSTEKYPVPENAMTAHDANHWTGTVVDVQQTAQGVIPTSGAAWAEKITGLATHDFRVDLNNYDSIKGIFCPEALAQTLQVRLYSTDTDYWVLPRTFQGNTTDAFSLTGATSDAEVSKVIALASIRLSEITVVTDGSCQVKAKLSKAGVTQYESGYASCDGNGRRIVFPDAVYKADTADTLTLTFTQLYQVGVGYGASVKALQGREYYAYMTAESKTMVTDWSATNTYLLYKGGFPEGTYNPATIPALSRVVGTVVAGCQIGGQRYWFHGDRFKTSTPYTSFEMGASGSAYVQDSQLTLSIPANFPSFGVPEGEMIELSLFASVQIFTMKSVTVPPMQLWDYRAWSYGSTYPLWDAFELMLASKAVGAGSPTNAITKVGLQLAAGGIFYLDTLAVASKQRTWHGIEVSDAESIAKYGDRFSERKLDSVYTENSARILAAGLLAISKDPAVNYSVKLPADAPVALGTPVATDDGTLPVIALQTSGDTIDVQIGSPQQSLRETLAALARKQDAIQRVL